MGRKKKRSKSSIDDIRERIWKIGSQLNNTFVDRNDVIKVMILAYLSGEHYLLVGEPGTGKTAIVEKFASHIEGAKWFGATLGSFTSPEKIFGPLDINAFQAGQYTNVTKGKLPEADIAFLDEFFKCSDGCLNEMLTVLNERRFDGEKIPLRTIGTATNWPELQSRSDKVLALYDRILLRCIIDDVSGEENVVRLLEQVERVDSYEPEETITLDELDLAIADIHNVEIDRSIRVMLHSVRERLSIREVNGETRKGIAISSRRIGQLQKVLKAHAWLNNRYEVTLEDFECLQWGLWNDRSDYETVCAVINTLDADVVKGLISMIDDGRKAYNETRVDGYKSLKVNQVTDLIKDIATKVRTKLDEPVFTDKGRDSIIKAMELLKRDFSTLNEMVEKSKLNSTEF